MFRQSTFQNDSIKDAEEEEMRKGQQKATPEKEAKETKVSKEEEEKSSTKASLVGPHSQDMFDSTPSSPIPTQLSSTPKVPEPVLQTLQSSPIPKPKSPVSARDEASKKLVRVLQKFFKDSFCCKFCNEAFLL